MKTIKLKSISLHYFKGIRSLTLDFNESTTNIFGANATGKTTIFDAFTWLLFGKDSSGNSDSKFEIKTRDENGNVIEKLDHVVSAVLRVNGYDITLKRIFREKWEKKRGEVISTFTGHETVCYFDEVPVSITEYNKRIGELLNENLFKLITNPLYFNSLNWKDRRNVIIDLAGEVTNDFVAGLRPEFAELIASLNGKTLDDLKAKTAQQKRTINDQLKLIPTRIDEAKRSIPQALDFAEIEKEIAEKRAEVEKLETYIADNNKAYNDQIAVINQKRNEVNALKNKQSDVIFKAQQAEQNRVFEANAERNTAESKLRIAKSTLARLESDLKQSENDISISRRISGVEEQIQQKRNEWNKVNAEEYKHLDDQETTCPLCGTKGNKQFDNAKLSKEFYQTKIEKLEAINQEGAEMAERKKVYEKNLAIKTGVEADLKNQISESKKEVAELEKQLSETSTETAKTITPAELPAWVELDNQIKALEAEILMPAPADASTSLSNRYLSEKKGIEFEIAELKIDLSKKDQIEQVNKRIAELENEEQNLAHQVANFEAIEHNILEFNKAKMEEVDKRVNDLFSFVRFKLFDTQINGAEVECCETLINTNGSWVSYNAGGNTAGQINGGIDIINAICKKNGVTAPIFIDNRESVNEIIPTASQIINLIVSHDKELVIK